MKYQDNGGGTVTDISTGLMWQKETLDRKFTWHEAADYCRALNLAGHNDWRLPTIEELTSITNAKMRNLVFRCFPTRNWSSSTNAGDTSYAWCVNLYNGYVAFRDKSNRYYVRAVREGKVPQSHHISGCTYPGESDGRGNCSGC